MASFNNTQTKLIRTTNRYSNIPTTRLSPIPLPGESFYFNQDYVKVKINDIRIPIHNQVIQRTSVHLTDKRIIILAQPLSNDDSSDDDHNTIDDNQLWTFQLDLPFILSLKTSNVKKHKIVLDISVQNQWESIQIHLSFNNQKKKKDHARRDSFKEYINLVMAGYASNRSSSSSSSIRSSSSSSNPIPTTTTTTTNHSSSLRRHFSNSSSTFNHYYYYTPSIRSNNDHLPTYLQALADAPLIPSSINNNLLFASNHREELPPAYS